MMQLTPNNGSHLGVLKSLTIVFQISGTGNEPRITASDPSHHEEAVMSGKLVLGVNPYREICTLHLAGQMLIEKVSTILRLVVGCEGSFINYVM